LYNDVIFVYIVFHVDPASGLPDTINVCVCNKKLNTLCYHMVKTRSLYLTWPWIRTGSWQTDRRTDGRTDVQNCHS